jgi:hypothetical protein
MGTNTYRISKHLITPHSFDHTTYCISGMKVSDMFVQENENEVYTNVQINKMGVS